MIHLLFWIERFIRNKLTTLSNRQVNDKDKLALIIQNLVKGTKIDRRIINYCKKKQEI